MQTVGSQELRSSCRCYSPVYRHAFDLENKVVFYILYSPFFNRIGTVGPSWSWSYDSYIYNYLFNQCLSLLMLWVRIPRLATGRWFSPGTPVASTNWPPRYNWNIVESGVKHLKTNQPTLKDILRSYFSIERLIRLNCWEHICVQYTIAYMTAKTISFPMVNFPFFDGDVPLAPSYSAYFSQLVRFVRICDNVSDFSDCNLVITNETVTKIYYSYIRILQEKIWSKAVFHITFTLATLLTKLQSSNLTYLNL